MHDLASRYILVNFTAKQGSIRNTKCYPPQVIATAKWKQNQYQLPATILSPVAYTSWTISIPRRKHKTSALLPHLLTQQPSSPHTTLPVISAKPIHIATHTNWRSLYNTTNPRTPTPAHLSTHSLHLRLNYAQPVKISVIAYNDSSPPS